MQMLPVPFESDVGIRIMFKKFFQIYKDESTPDDCNWFDSDNPREFNNEVVDWRMDLYGPFSEISLKDCCALNPHDYVFHARRNGNLNPTVPSDWPFFKMFEGGWDASRKAITFYIERTWVRNMRIRDFFLAIGYGVPNRNAMIKPAEGELVGRAALPPLVVYVHDTYSKFGNNGMDWVGDYFRSL